MLTVSRALGDFFLHPFVIADPFINCFDITEGLKSIPLLWLSDFLVPLILCSLKVPLHCLSSLDPSLHYDPPMSR